MKNKNIAVVLFNYPLGVSTMIINTIDMLRIDNTVKIYTNGDQSQNIPCDPWLEKLVEPIIDKNLWHEENHLIGKLFRMAKRILRFILIKESWESKNFRLLRFSKLLKQSIEKNQYDIIMAVEAFSLIAIAEVCKNNSDVEIIYFDMELLDWAEVNLLYVDKTELKKRQHRILNDRVNRVVITSFNRADIFSQINNFPRERVFVLPVVPRKRQHNTRSDYFRKKYNIGDDKYIVVYSGNFMPWAQCLEIIESMTTWPCNAVLVMHTWNRSAMESDYFKKMQDASKGFPTYFSADYLLYTELGQALTSADIGLMFYESIDDNFTEICFSSNKMGEYLASGLPVICSPFPSLKEFIEKNEIGAAVSISEIGEAINKIIEDKTYYDKKVKECYNKHFIFDEYFNEVFNIRGNICKREDANG